MDKQKAYKHLFRLYGKQTNKIDDEDPRYELISSYVNRLLKSFKIQYDVLNHLVELLGKKIDRRI